MKQEINQSQFIDAFKIMDRENNFSYNGKVALFEYLTELEEDTGQEIELDIIALCCEYTEYEDLEEYLKGYSNQHEEKDDEESEEDFEKRVFEEIQDKTTLIKFENGFIIQQY